MTLNRSDYPEMSDEQWKQIETEGDRRATEASKTAKNGLLKPVEVQAKIDEAIEAERARLEADEQGKLELDRKAFETEKAAHAVERKSFTAKTKLLAAGLPEDKIEGLLPMFLGVDDKVLDATLDTFVKTYTEGVEAKVDSTKQALLDGASPPADPSGGPVDKSALLQGHLDAGNEAAAVEVLLEQAASAPTA